MSIAKWSPLYAPSMNPDDGPWTGRLHATRRSSMMAHPQKRPLQRPHRRQLFKPPVPCPLAPLRHHLSPRANQLLTSCYLLNTSVPRLRVRRLQHQLPISSALRPLPLLPHRHKLHQHQLNPPTISSVSISTRLLHLPHHPLKSPRKTSRMILCRSFHLDSPLLQLRLSLVADLAHFSRTRRSGVSLYNPLNRTSGSTHGLSRLSPSSNNSSRVGASRTSGVSLQHLPLSRISLAITSGRRQVPLRVRVRV